MHVHMGMPSSLGRETCAAHSNQISKLLSRAAFVLACLMRSAWQGLPSEHIGAQCISVTRCVLSGGILLPLRCRLLSASSSETTMTTT